MTKYFYIDTCIYLNLWQKEENKSGGIPYWQIAQDFFDRCSKEESIFYYSGFILKELKYILDEEEFNQKRKVFHSPYFKKIWGMRH